MNIDWNDVRTIDYLQLRPANSTGEPKLLVNLAAEFAITLDPPKLSLDKYFFKLRLDILFVFVH